MTKHLTLDTSSANNIGHISHPGGSVTESASKQVNRMREVSSLFVLESRLDGLVRGVSALVHEHVVGEAVVLP